MRILCDKIRNNLRSPLGQWILDEYIYITSWQWFLSCDFQKLYYKEHETWYKYMQPPNGADMGIEFQTDTNSKYKRPSHFQVCRIILTSSTPTYLLIKATTLDFPPDTSGPPLESSKEEGTSESKLGTYFKKTEHWQKWLVSHLTYSDKLDALYSDFTSG